MIHWILGGRSPIGLEVGNRWVKAVQLRGRPGRWSIAAAARFERPAGVRGAIEPAEAERLAAILARQGFAGHRVTLVMPATMEIALPLTLPGRRSGAPLDEMARAQLADAARCEPSSLTASWWLRGTESAGGTFPAMAAGVRTRDADTLADSIEAGGLEVVAVDVRGCALARACAPVLDGGAAVTAIVAVGHSVSMVVAVLGGVPVYERVLPELGLKELHERLTADLAMEPDAIAYALARVGAVRPPGGAAASPPDRSASSGGADQDRRTFTTQHAETMHEVRARVEAHAHALAHEVRVSLSYAASTSAGAEVGSALLVGDGAEINGLCEMFGASLGQPSRVVRPADIALCPPWLHAASSQASLVLACGLAMNDPRVPAGEARP